jgi:methylated-DNA-protein-cysteine methyltransferase related protein
MKSKIIYKKPRKTSEKKEKETFYSAESISFFEKVYQVVLLVPKGRVTTYGAIAKYLGTGGSSRMVGWAMNASHGSKPRIPAQRVVNRMGLLTGKTHFGASDAMEKLLKKDGVKVKDDQVVDFKERFWDPMKELEL